MKTLANEQDAAELRVRLAAMNGDEQRQWGKMSAAEMLCHVREAFNAAVEGRQLTVVAKSPVPTRVLKRVALSASMKWPEGVQTPRELEAGQPGVVPVDFAQDRAAAITALDRFCAVIISHEHPILGPMEPSEWLRWGYLHTDHHLRQFGR